MTSFTIRKVRSSKSSFIVVAGRATLNPALRKVHRRNRGRDLTPARHTGPHHVATAAIQRSDASMLGMIKVLGECRCPVGISARTSRLVARIARSDFLAADLRPWAVTLVARIVRPKTRRDGQGDTSPRRLMTGCTTGLPKMPCVIETHIKAAQTGKSSHRSRLSVGVTHGADLAAAVGELLDVASRARQMPRKFRGGRIVVTFVT